MGMWKMRLHRIYPQINDVLVLGIETTAHTFGVGIADSNGNIFANTRSVYIPQKGGIHPREAAEHHVLHSAKVLKQAIDESGISIEEIDGIAASFGPGLGPCLRVGCTIARALAIALKKPLVEVNHCLAHIEIAKLDTGLVDPLVVYVSGGNTIISAYASGRYRIFGETLDIALGNCLDVFAREVGLGFPGVPAVEKCAEKGQNYIPLPYVVKGQDITYSGLLTAALEAVRKGAELKDVCLSLVETAYSMLVEVTERALVHTGKKGLILTGGLARSRKLRSMLKSIAEDHNVTFKPVSDEYAGDNGAMIAYTGALMLACGIRSKPEKSSIKQRWRLDEVDVPWMKKLLH